MSGVRANTNEQNERTQLIELRAKLEWSLATADQLKRPLLAAHISHALDRCRVEEAALDRGS